jgi:hypothetical protein
MPRGRGSAIVTALLDMAGALPDMMDGALIGARQHRLPGTVGDAAGAG